MQQPCATTCFLSTADSLIELVEVLRGGGDVETPSASKCPATSGSNDVGESVRDGIGLDDEWEHPRICQDTSRCRPAWACKFSVWGLATTDGGKKLQLAGVAKGLIYIHSQGMIHGNLKGVRL